MLLIIAGLASLSCVAETLQSLNRIFVFCG